jgi:hypothetical protein
MSGKASPAIRRLLPAFKLAILVSPLARDLPEFPDSPYPDARLRPSRALEKE